MGDGAFELVAVEGGHGDGVIANQLTEPRHGQRSVVEVGPKRQQHAHAALFVCLRLDESGGKARTSLGVGVGEEFLELIHDEHELGFRVLRQHPADGPGQAAVVRDQLIHQRRDRGRREAQERVLGLVERVRSRNHRRHPRAPSPQRRHETRPGRVTTCPTPTDPPRRRIATTPSPLATAPSRLPDRRSLRRRPRQTPADPLYGLTCSRRIASSVRLARARGLSSGTAIGRDPVSSPVVVAPRASPAAAERNARTSSPMSANRFAGSGDVAVRITASIAGGRSGRSVTSDATGPDALALTSAARLSAS